MMRVCDPEASANSDTNFEGLAAEGARPWESGYRRCYAPAEFLAALRAVRDSHGPATAPANPIASPATGRFVEAVPSPPQTR